MSVAISLYWGSSPHTRGARSSQSPDLTASRIIPAYAGSTHRRRCPHPDVEDHPRIRGEHKRAFKNARIVIGSSPHTRGALDAEPRPSVVTRIIPAYAGSTPKQEGGGLGHADHPRIRGEHRMAETPHQTPPGSSPHTRGAREGLRQRRQDSGIIPAYAGSTLHHHEIISCSRGSSPHTRGARVVDVVDLEDQRIIPAYAGSTPSVYAETFRESDHPRIRGEHPRRR